MSLPERPRLRRDLTWRRFVMEGQDSYMFRDDITHEYNRVDAVSGAIALQMDGTKSLDDLLAWAEATFQGLSFDRDYIEDLVQDFKHMKFLDDPFQRSAMLIARAREERSQINAATFKNIFSIPLGTVNPDRFLTRTYPYVSFMFQKPAVVLGMALFALAGYVVWANRDHVPAAGTFFVIGDHGLAGGIAVWLVIMLTIIVHELGHGYAVKHHGGKVDRLGFLFMFGMPCMFCDTTDSHMFPDWKHRAHVALAGTYTEFYMAAIATVVWWLTPNDLLINLLAYNVILFASISGILFNYNPLLKMDGYYTLADVLDMPSLQEDAYAYLGWLVRRYALGMKEECPAVGRRRKQILLAYGALSIAYSAFFSVMVFLLFRRLLIQYLSTIGVLLSLVLLASVLKRPLRPLFHTARLWVLERGTAWRRRRPLLIGVGAALAAAFLLVPVPGTLTLRAVTLEPARTAALIAPEDLRLREADFHAGDRVRAGQTLAILDAEPVRRSAEEAAARGQSLRIAEAAARRAQDDSSAALFGAEARGEAGRSQWLERRAGQARLAAPFDGRVLTAGLVGVEGTKLAAGDTLCLVGDFSGARAVARVSEFDLDDVRLGAPVRLRLRALPGPTLRGVVQAIEPEAEVAGKNRPRTVRVWIALDRVPEGARAGFAGRARARTPARPTVVHLARWLVRFVRADLWV